jgi:hypothetical protein
LWPAFFAASAAVVLLAAAGSAAPGFRDNLFGLPLPSPAPSAGAANAKIVVVNGCSGDLTAYPVGSNGDVAPLVPPRDFNPFAVAVDTQKNIYVLDACRQVIDVYSAGSASGSAPAQVIGGLDAGQPDFGGLNAFTLDSSGNLYVAAASDLDFIAIFAHGATGNAKPIGVITGSATQMNGVTSLAVDSTGKIYVANYFGSVTVYAPGSTGDAAPIANIVGPHTGLPVTGPIGVAVDPQGNIYVLSVTYSAGGVLPNIDTVITVYAAGANGDAAPVRTISGPDTGLNAGWGRNGMAVDASGNVYVANFSYTENGTTFQQLSTSRTIEVFSPSANGDATPSTVISGTGTDLNLPFALALDSSGNIYVGDAGYRGAVYVYPAGSHGNAKPSVTFGGPGIIDYFRYPVSAAADSGGNVYVLSSGGFAAPAIDIHAAANVSGAPIATITGPHTHMSIPTGLAVASNGEIYVSNYDSSQNGSILIYAPSSKGDEPPISMISGPKTGLVESDGIAIAPNGTIFVSNQGPSEPSVTAYLQGSTGNVRPFATISGPATGLSIPTSLAFDSGSDLYVLDFGSEQRTVDVFAARKFGNVAPIDVIAGPDTGLVGGGGGQIAIDPSGKLYSANGTANTVTVHAPGSNGDAAPLAVISGPDTGVGYPVGIVITQPQQTSRVRAR